MLQHGSIPPNLHFSEVNPKIARYHGPGALVVPTTLLPWPQLPPGAPKRASVNSFGFGGTNSHVILESPAAAELGPAQDSAGGVVGPLLLSANSGPALLRSVRSHLEYLQRHADVPVGNVSRVLQTRRSTHRVRVSFTGATRQRIVEAMADFVASHVTSPPSDIGTVARLVNPKEAPGILGIFTGQGAQWATMGRELLRASPVFRRSVEACEAVLRNDLLPGDAPAWSLVDELVKEAGESRVHEAAVAQPLCTALQIGLVDVLGAAGVRLGGVVGHSSGEIAAAYAAGILSARAAMQIAYYRGFYAHVCGGRDGVKGGMLAVGLSMQRAQQLCSQPALQGRLVVAASNAPQSCTLSGDVDAVDAAKQQLDGEGVFARRLLVDTAYHSHHMQACVAQYAAALDKCNVHVTAPRPSGPIWTSSVRGDARLLRGNLAALQGPYWIDNMVQTVKFSQAVEASLWSGGGPWDVALEIGPHGALKGPVAQTLKAAFGAAPHYASLLERNKNDVEAVQAAIAHVWTQLGTGHVDFAGYRRSFGDHTPSSILRGLPTYAWDHDRVHWRESRSSMRFRTQPHAGHELLGRRVADDNNHELRWRNILKLDELPWLRGHDVLGAVLLPAAAYVSMAAQAASQLAATLAPHGPPMHQLSVEDMDILRPIAVPDHGDGIETLFTVHVLSSDASTSTSRLLRARFSYYYAAHDSTSTAEAMIHTCTGTMVVRLASASANGGCPLPQRQSLPHNLVQVASEPIYAMFRHMSLNYTGAFQAITESHRCLGYAASTAAWPTGSPVAPTALSHNHYVVHPAMLDVAFQSLFVAHTHPATQQAKSAAPLLPSHIDRVIIDPQQTLASSNSTSVACKFDAWVVSATRARLEGDINIYHDVSGQALIQIEGLSARAADGGQSASLDKQVFWKTVYGHDASLGGLLAPPHDSSAVADDAIAQLLKQITFKFPRCKLLEMGNGTGQTTTAQSILNLVQDLYESYTYTDPSPQVLSTAAATLANFERTACKTLDISQDVHPQGFNAHSYHVIIAPQVLSAISTTTTTRLDDILDRVRMLLRPGGYLVLSEMTGSPSTTANNDGSMLSPGEWHRQLRTSGFSGAETIAYDNVDESRHLYSCIVTRAVNDDFMRLVKPLPPPASMSTRPLIVIGGRGLYSSKMIEEMENLLPSSWRQSGLIHIVPSIDHFTMHDGLEGVAVVDVICFQDVDEAVFAQLPVTKTRLKKLQLLMMSAANLLWVTGAGTSLDPRASMILGIARVVPVEMPHLTMQVLGLEMGANMGPAAHARHCTEALLRLRYTGELKAKALDKQSSPGGILWAIEPESEILADGTIRIQRLVLDIELNQQYNAKSRTIVKPVKTTTNAMVRTIVPKGASKMQLQAVHEPLSSSSLDSSKDIIQVRIQHTIHIPSHSDHGQELYLVCGQQVPKEQGQQLGHAVMALSHVNASRLLVESDKLIHVASEHLTPKSLEHVADNLLRFAIVNRVQSYASANPTAAPLHVLLVQPEVNIANTLHAELTQAGHQVYCVSWKTDADIPDGWIRLHANMSSRMVWQCLPSCSIDLLVDWPMKPSERINGSEHLRKLLPLAHETCHAGADLLWDIFHKNGSCLATLSAAADIRAEDITKLGQISCNCQIKEAGELSGADATSLAYQRYITDWSHPQPLPLTVQPLHVRLLGLLRSDRTYLLVGSSNGLGISLCQWMLSQGAKHIVITSRHPKENAQLNQAAHRLGASVHFIAMDVTQRDQVLTVVGDIRRTMPPIAGVCNLAMVLNDKMFREMSVSQLNTTLEAKVIGTEILDQVFDSTTAAAANPPLDFFVLTSSLASVVGNIGQANYHSANLFMASIMEKRRSRGLAGSIIHIGWIADTGYVARSDKKHQLADHFQSIRFIPLSETDVQEAFAQAIQTSKPRHHPNSELHGHAQSYEITMGLELPTEPMQENQANKALWVSSPRLMALAPYTTSSPSSTQQRPGQDTLLNSSLKQQISKAETAETAAAVVASAFAAKLETILALPTGSVQADLERPIVEFGIDSLIATEIRTWLLNDIDIDVDIFSILGGDSVMQISVQATKTMWTGSTSAKGKPAKDDESVVSPSTSASATAAVDLIDSASSSSQSLGDMASTSFALSHEDASITSDQSSCKEDGLVPDNGKNKQEKIMARPTIIREAPMSAAQSRIWFISNHHRNPAAQTNALHYHVQGNLDTVRLQQAFQMLAHQHEILRTCFYSRLEDGHPMQGIMAKSAIELTIVHEKDQHSDGNDEYYANLQDTISAMKSRAWGLEQGRTMEIILLCRNATEYDMVIGYHHIIMDGWSMSIFLRDMDRAYKMQSFDAVSHVSYVDYSIHELSEEKVGSFDKDIAFWRSEFENLPNILPPLPMARRLERSSTTATGKESSSSHYLDEWLSPIQFVAQKDLCKRLHISSFHLHLALLQVLLARLADIEDVCVGIVDANRRDVRFWDTMGCFVNMLPLRCNVSRTTTFAQVAMQASRKSVDVFSHGNVPFDRILDHLRVPRMSGTNPLFQAAINYRSSLGNIDILNSPLGDDCRMHLSAREVKEAENPYDVSMGFLETPTKCLLQVWCRDDLYNQNACETILYSYLRLLESVARDPDVPVAKIMLHADTEVSHALQIAKGPVMDFGWPTTLSQRVQDMCLLYPQRQALTDTYGEEISYGQLSNRISHVAQKIQDAGAHAGTRVAILCEPSADSVVAMLAVLHMGCVYIPLDTSLPPSRHADMIHSCKPTLLLCHLKTELRVKELSRAFVDMQTVRLGPVDDAVSCDDDKGQVEPSVLPVVPEPEAPAICLFTSGSTGKPKGILLTQANFINHIAVKTHQMGLQQECVLQQSSLGFDMSLIQIFSALANGGRLIIAGPDIRRDPIELSNLVFHERISMTIATPTEYLAWINCAANVLRQNLAWRFAFSGGEKIPNQLIIELRRLNLPNLSLTNCYGPTETTAAATFQSISLEPQVQTGFSCISSVDPGPWSQYAVGKALPNYSLCIIDAAGHPLPTGYTGEICIGGSGVALGYLGQPDETNAKFVNYIMVKPRMSETEGSHGIMYRTGDKGRLLSDGTLLFLGRLGGDTQIKLRGQRIELQEVEMAVLQASEGALASVVVSLRNDVLIAHGTLSKLPLECNQSDLTQRILRRVMLPQAFIPGALCIIDALPRTPNGKLDREAIAKLPLERSEKDDNATSNSTEKMSVREGELRLLWERVLPKFDDVRLGPSSDFFMCGGNSMLLMKLQNAIKETTGLQISTRHLYESSTLRAMAQCVFNKADLAATEHDVGPIDWAIETSVPVSLHQKIQALTSNLFSGVVASSTEGIEILLTGATSFLGSHLLRSFIASSSVKTVHCVTVPADEQASLPQDNTKVVYYNGSLLSPSLGLTTQECITLEQTVQVIVHVGAHGHCLNRFDSLRVPNLHSLHFLASLALPRSVPFLFLSSSRVVHLSGNTAPIPGSMKSTTPAADGKDGYTASKWAGEVFLENLVDHLNDTQMQQQHQNQMTRSGSWRPSLKVEVHRPCTLASDQAPNSDAMNAILRYSRSMHCAPRLKRAEGYMDFAPIENVVASITDAALDLAMTTRQPLPKNPMGDASWTKWAEITFRHHSGGIKSPMGDFKAHLERVYQGTFEEVDMQEWVVRAAQHGLDPLIVAYIEALLDSGMPIVGAYMGEK